MSRKISIHSITLVLAGKGFLLLLIWAINFEEWQAIPVLFSHLLLITAFFLFGLLGLIYAIRQEIPQISMIRGGTARILGVAISVFWWCLGFYAIYLFYL